MKLKSRWPLNHWHICMFCVILLSLHHHRTMRWLFYAISMKGIPSAVLVSNSLVTFMNVSQTNSARWWSDIHLRPGKVCYSLKEILCGLPSATFLYGRSLNVHTRDQKHPPQVSEECPVKRMHDSPLMESQDSLLKYWAELHVLDDNPQLPSQTLSWLRSGISRLVFKKISERITKQTMCVQKGQVTSWTGQLW